MVYTKSSKYITYNTELKRMHKTCFPNRSRNTEVLPVCISNHTFAGQAAISLSLMMHFRKKQGRRLRKISKYCALRLLEYEVRNSFRSEKETPENVRHSVADLFLKD